MKHLFHSGRYLVADMASTIFFLILVAATRNVPLAVGLGMALGVGQICLQFARKRPIDTMQWLSLFLVLASGTATLVTHDARFVLVKPSIIYVIIGVVMLKPGWMNRYLPEVAVHWVSDVARVFGFVWAGLMFVSAAVNLALALSLDALTWAGFMSAWGIGSKLTLFLVQFGAMRFIGARRRRASEASGLVPAAA